MELREPQRKHVKSRIKVHQPLPILIESESGINSDRNLWPLYTGIYNGECVVICNQEEMVALHNMGFFGKGSFSRGFPTFNLIKNNTPPFIFGRQWNRRKKWMKDIEDNFKNQQINIEDKNVASKTPEVLQIEEEDSVNSNSQEELQVQNEVVVVNDSDDNDENILNNPQVTIENENIKTVQETLNLSLEEAFFLSYALGCLQVFDITGHCFSLVQMWCIFCKEQSDFLENYVAYHYFRAKGWIVKPGYKFGGDLMLYKQGPTFYHASYIVLVESVKDRQNHSNNLSWNKLHGINRVVEAARKEVLICQVFWPIQLEAEELDSPLVLPKFEVNEILLRRWIPSQEREDKK